MNYIFTLFFLVFTTNTIVVAQVDLSVKTYSRFLKFINLRDHVHEPFFRNHQELPTLLMRGIRNKELQAYSIDYNNSLKVTTLNLTDWKKTLIGFTYPEEKYVEYVFDRDFEVLSIDMVEVPLKKAKYDKVFLYLNFHLTELTSASGKLEYRFSLKWYDVLSYLSKQNELYYSNSRRHWWRGNVFITHGQYTIDCGAAGEMIRLSREVPSFKAKHEKIASLYDLSVYDHIVNFRGEPFDEFLLESSANGIYQVKNIGFEEIPLDYSGDITPYSINPFVFDFLEYQKIAIDSSWINNSSVMSFDKALANNRFSWSKEINTISLFENKRIENDKIQYYNDLLNENKKQRHDRSFDKLKVESMECIKLHDPRNQTLFSDSTNLISFIVDQIRKGKLNIYTNQNFTDHQSLIKIDTNVFDGWLTTLSFKGRKNATDSYFFYNEGWFNNNTNSRSVKRGDTIEYNNKQFVANKNLLNYDRKIYPNSADWTLIQPEYFSVEKFDYLYIVNNITFNNQGENKKYELKGLEIMIPYNAEGNTKGIEIALGYIKWEELRPLLIIKYPEMVAALEKRKLFTYLLTTSVLKQN